MKTFFVGVDEVGRGCIAGPVVAAAVILKKKEILSLKDSKLLSPKKRKLLSEDIKRNCIEYSIAKVSSKKIDKIKPLNTCCVKTSWKSRTSANSNKSWDIFTYRAAHC